MPISALPQALLVATASATVAASDAQAGHWTGADRRATGTNDQVDLQAAHDALPGGGGTILLSEGTFTLGATLTLTKPCRFVGQGAGITTLRVASGVNVGNLMDASAASNIGLYRLTLDGQRATGAVANLLNATGNSGARVYDCSFVNASGYAVVFSGRSDVYFVGNHVENIAGSGGVVNFVAVGAGRPVRNVYMHNTFKDVTSVSNRPAAINLGRCDHVRLIGNHFTNCDGGIANEHCQYQTIASNTMSGCRDSLRVGPSDAPGVGEQTDHHASITGNIVTGATVSAGITIQGNHVSCVGNVSRSGAQHGIAIQSSRGGYGAGSGFTARHINLTGNVCVGNTLDGIALTSDASYSGSGIVQDIIVSSNDVSANTRYGISLSESTANDLQDLIVSLNDCRGNGTAGLGGSYPGTLQARSTLHFFHNQGVTSGLAQIPTGPTSGVAYPNPYGADATVYVSGGTVSQIAVAGQNTGLTAGAFRIPFGQTITVTFSSAPSVLWVLD